MIYLSDNGKTFICYDAQFYRGVEKQQERDQHISSDVCIDVRCFVTYHSRMSETNDSPNYRDPLTVGELISLQEAAEYAGLEKSTLPNYIKRGRLKAKKIGSQWVTTRAAIDEYLQSRSLDNIPKKHRNGD